MPTFFSRKYMRGKPQRTERLVGAFVLGLLAFIVFAFLLTGGLFAGLVNRSPALKAARDFLGISDKPLFVVAPENLKPPHASHELRVAEAMLPVLEGWKREQVAVGAPEVLPGGFERGCVYTAEYTGPGRQTVSISDLGTPEAAFGVWRAIRPANARRINVGVGGWCDPEGGATAFWAGRYLTEIKSQTGLDPEQAEAFARSIAAVQIHYGGPFWAEAVLPAEERVEDSLRYCRKAGLGLEELADLWTADYPAGVTLGVMRPKSPEAVLAALRTRFEKAGPAGEGSESDTAGAPVPDVMAALGQDIAAGRHDGRLMIACSAGPYVFVATGEQAEPILTLAKAMRERWAGGAGEAVAVASGAGPAVPKAGGAARFAEVEGGDVQPPTKIERFTDNLYEKIDGREGQYRAFGFVELRFGQYQDTRRQQTYDVYLYDMGQPNNAMGIYMAEKSEGAQAIPVGQEGYLSGANAYFYKGKYYVNVLGPSEGDQAAAENARRIAVAIAETIADTGKKLWADALLPREGRLELKYQPESALAHDFLDRFFFATYKLEGVEFKMFIHKAPGADEAKALFAKYAEEAPKYDTLVSRESSDGGETIVTESMGAYTVAFHKGPYFAGVTDCKDRERAIQQAAAFCKTLNADDKGEPAPAGAAPKDESPSEAEGGDEYGY